MNTWNSDGTIPSIQGIHDNPLTLEGDTITLPSSIPTAGTWSVTCEGQTASGLAYNISAGALQTALNALSTISGDGGVVVTGSVSKGFTVAWNTIRGGGSGTARPYLSANVSGLTAPTTISASVSKLSSPTGTDAAPYPEEIQYIAIGINWDYQLQITKAVNIVGDTIITGDYASYLAGGSPVRTYEAFLASPPIVADDRTIVLDNSPRPNFIPIGFAPVATIGTGSVSGITIRCGSSQAKATCAIGLVGARTFKFRIHHMHFDKVRVSPAVFDLFPAARGVADHCVIDASPDAYGFAVTAQNGDTNNADTVYAETAQFGSEDFFYFEDCQFHSPRPDTGPWGSFDAYNGGKYVVRNSILVNCAPGGGHGSEGQRSYRAAESYNNTLISSTTYRGTPMARQGGVARGASVLMYNNNHWNWSTTAPMFQQQLFRMQEINNSWGPADGTNDLDSNADADGITPVPAGTDGYLFFSGNTPQNNTAITSPFNLNVLYRDSATAAWIPHTMQDYVLRNVNLARWHQSYIYDNDADTLWYNPQDGGSGANIPFLAGDRYEIRKVLQALDQAGVGKGDLMAGGAKFAKVTSIVNGLVTAQNTLAPHEKFFFTRLTGASGVSPMTPYYVTNAVDTTQFWFSTQPDAVTPGASTNTTANASGGFIQTKYNTVTGVPSRPRQVLEPMYGWLNRNNGSQIYDIGTHGEPIYRVNKTLFQENTNFLSNPAVGIGVGLLADRPTSGMVANVGYWATDTNTLYRALSPTAWSSVGDGITYRPLPYPHPLTNTIQAASPEHDDVLAAINLAVNGMTVLIPAGTAHWTQALGFVKSISLVGATTVSGDHDSGLVATDRTIIINDIPADAVMINMIPHISDGALCMVKGITFRGFGTTHVDGSGNPIMAENGGAIRFDTGTDSDQIRVNQCHFDRIYGRDMIVQGQAYGVCDHCVFDTVPRGQAAYILNGGNFDTYGDESFSHEPFFGTNKFWFFEDCQFNNNTADPTISTFGGLDSHQGGRWVSRYCIWNNCQPSGHGTETGARGRGMRAFESYNNKFNWAGYNQLAAIIRSGSGLVHDNAYQNYADGPHVTCYRYFGTFTFGAADGTSPWDINDPTNYTGNTGVGGASLGGGPNGLLASGVVTSVNNNTLSPGVSYPSNSIQVAGNPWTDNQWVGYAFRNRATPDFQTQFLASTTVSTSTFNKTAHGLTNGVRVVVWNFSQTTGFATFGKYYVVNAAANTFQLSTISGGSPVIMGGANDPTIVVSPNFSNSFVVANNSNTLWFYSYYATFDQSSQIFVGEHFEIRKVLVALDQPGMGKGDLISGDYPNMVISSGPNSGTVANPNQRLEGVWYWGNTDNLGNIRIISAFPESPYALLLEGRDYYNRQPSNAEISAFNGVPYTGPYTYPHPLARDSSSAPPPPADTTKPTVSITAPANGGTISGIVNLTCSAADDVAVASVQWKIDGANQGAPVTAAPYTLSNLNTQTLTNGSHTITATATDTSGNVSDVASITVTVANAPNVAAASMGATASASSQIGGGFPVASVNNGDRKGLNWGSGGGWNDGTQNAFPDWVQIDFPSSKTINEIDVFTVQDNYASPAEPTLSMTFSQFGIVDFQVQYWNGSSWVDIAVVTGNNKVWRQFTFSSVTTTKIRVLVNNALGGYSRITEIEAYQPLVADTTNPTVSITSPANGATVSNTISSTCSAADNVAVASVQWKIDGINSGSPVTLSPFTMAPLDTTTLSNGSHTISAVATDTSGNLSTASTVTVTVANTTPDTTKPVISITSPASGATLTGVTTFLCTATDNVAVAGVQWKIDGINLGAEKTTAPYSLVNFDTASIATGNHTLTATARDTSGNLQTASIGIIISNTTPDVTNPVVNITSPADGASVSGIIFPTCLATDDRAVASVQWKVDGANRTLATSSPFAFGSLDADALGAGTHTISARATDTSGNVSALSTVTFTVTTPAPPPPVPPGKGHKKKKSLTRWRK